MKLPNISKKIFIVVGGLGLASAGAVGAIAFQSHAQSRINAGTTASINLTNDANQPASGSSSSQSGSQTGNPNWQKPAVSGKITAISGNTITVAGSNSTTYTVDASNATVDQIQAPSNPSSSNLSALQVGQEVMIQGTVSGTSVTATKITFGNFPMAGFRGHGPGMGKQGISGTVSAVNGNSITLTASTGTPYTVDASNAKVYFVNSGGVTQNTDSAIQVGDTVKVMGKVSGDSIAANMIIDGQIPQISKPVAVGTVSAISGNTITLTGQNKTTYTIDASNATVYQINQPASGTTPQLPYNIVKNMSLSGINVGDTLRVEGTLSGTNVTATTILDGKLSSNAPLHKRPKPQPGSSSSTSTSASVNTNAGKFIRSLAKNVGL